MSANPAFDLTTVAEVKAWISSNGSPSTNTSDDANIQLAITGFSLFFLRETGYLYGDLPSASIFVQPVTFSEWYDGTGSDRLYLRNQPIRSVTTVQANGIAIPQSTAYGVRGYLIHQDGASLVMRCGGGSFTSLGRGIGSGVFPRGMQNISIQYSAGFAQIPADAEELATVVVAQNFKRNTVNLDQESIALGGMGMTTKFRAWDMPPNYRAVVESYSRNALIGR